MRAGSHTIRLAVAAVALLLLLAGTAQLGRAQAAAPADPGSRKFLGWCSRVPLKSFDRQRKLSLKQLRCLAIRVGWRGRDARRAAAVAMAESRGRVKAIERVHRNGLGLFQIDRRFWDISRRCAMSAVCNARYARKQVFRRHGFHAWATYSYIHPGERTYRYCRWLGKAFKHRHERRCLA